MKMAAIRTIYATLSVFLFLPNLTTAWEKGTSTASELVKVGSILESNDDKRVDLALKIVEGLIYEICPQQKRVVDLASRVAIAQQEMADKVKGKPPHPAPLLSFIMPCYNRAKILHEVIDSIFRQELTIPYEIIVVDDCSTDKSYEILLEYEKKYDHFFVFRNPKNLKAPTTRNRAIAYARGRYICNADSDDVFEPSSIEPMLHGMIDRGLEVAFFEELRFFEDIKKPNINIARSLPLNHVMGWGPMIKEYYIATCAGNRIMTKNSWLKCGGYLEKPGHDSWAFSYKLLSNGYSAYVCPGSGYRHRTWADKSNMWWNDLKTHDISPLQAVMETPELFAPRSFQLLSQYQPKGDQFMQYLSDKVRRGEIRWVNGCDDILKAYLYENTGEYEQALKFYMVSIQNGEPHPNLYLRALRVALQLKEEAVALQLMEGFALKF